jgi:D-alanyl-D-alanine carboxypeptidase
MALGAPGAAAGGAFLVQIGAFNSPAEADRALSATRERAGDLIGSFAPVTAAVQKENRQFYRARFAGFDAQTAASTCLELRRRQIDCFVMKSE